MVRRNVLIFDDDYNQGSMMREYLVNTIDCDVQLVCLEEDFWKILKERGFDILFLDYRLQETNGLSVLERMDKAGYLIPTVMMTGEGNEKIAAKAIQNGAMDYLVKGDFPLHILPNLVQKAVQLSNLQQAMQRTLEKNRYQALLLNNMRDAVIVWGLDGEITYWNKAAEQLYGWEAVQMLGRSAYDVYFPAFDSFSNVPINHLLDKFESERRFNSAQGELIWISSQINILYNGADSSQPIGYMDVTRDITARKLEQEQLIHSQHLIQRILDTIPNIVYILDLSTKQINYVSQKIEPLLGIKVEDILSGPATSKSNLIHPADLPKILSHYERLTNLEDGESSEVEYRFKRDQRDWLWLKNRETVFARDQANQVSQIIGICEDITVRKLMEEELWHRLESDKLVLTISSNLLNLGEVDADQAFTQALGSVADFIGAEFARIFLQHDSRLTNVYNYSGAVQAEENPAVPAISLQRGDLPRLIKRLKMDEIVATHNLAHLPPELASEYRLLFDGNVTSAMISPLLYRSEVFGFLVFYSKRTEIEWKQDYDYLLQAFGRTLVKALLQKQSDEALRQSEARYRAIVEEHQTEMICRFLPDYTLTFVNEAFCRYYARERGKLVGTSFVEPIPEEDRDEVKAAIIGLSKENPVSIFAHHAVAPGGLRRWQEWVVRAIIDEHDRFVEFQAVGRDITERKLMEEQIRAAQTRLTQSTRLASIGQLASSVAHQISNPLTTIIADAQLLRQELGKDHPGRESAEAIGAAGWRAQQVIAELMKFSEPDHNARESLPLNETIQKAILLVDAYIKAAGIILSVKLPENGPSVFGNERQLTDLWVNLLLLARSTGMEDAPKNIWICTEKNEQGVVVEVRDDGKPIPSDQYESIFEPQLIPTGIGRGTGIELSLCREIVRQHQGSISVRSEGNLTTFRVILPEGLTNGHDEYLDN